MHRRHAVLAVALALAVGATLHVSAADLTRHFVAHATSHCQAALPAYDGALRKRPGGIRNEGQGIAFVTCSITTGTPLDGAGPGDDRLEQVSLGLGNGSGAPAFVTCTAVSGYERRQPVGYGVKAAAVQVDGGGIGWVNGDLPADANLHRSGAISISCGLPPGIEISRAVIRYTERFPGTG